jgi:hypothetical protein
MFSTVGNFDFNPPAVRNSLDKEIRMIWLPTGSTLIGGSRWRFGDQRKLCMIG